MPTGRVRGLTNPPPEVLRLERWLSPAVLAYSNRPDAHDLSSAPRGRVSFAEMENLRMGPRCAGSLGRFPACAFFTISLDMDRGPWLGAQVKMRATVHLRDLPGEGRDVARSGVFAIHPTLEFSRHGHAAQCVSARLE
jgi:hypothetical protein